MSRTLGFVVGTLAVCLVPHPIYGQDPPKKPAWDLDEVLGQLGHYPKDVYLQYVAMMLGVREGRDREVAERLEGLVRAELMEERAGRRARADLFSTFTGALAIQESLQLDTMRGERRGGRPGDRAIKAPIKMDAAKEKGPPEPPTAIKAEPPKAIPIAKIVGPGQKAHPWEKMLGDKKPEVGPLATCVPEEFWFAEFRNLAKIHEVTNLSELWGKHLFAQVLGEARSQLTVERIRQQLGFIQLPPKTLEAIQVDAVAMTGSDLFLGEGSDVTILVQGKGVAGLLALTMPALRLRAKEEKGEHAGFEYSHYATADGSLNLYAATPRPDLHVRSNSLPALKQVLDCVAAKGAKRLGETKEYQYLRTLMPYRALEEDAFVYLSDPFIRRLVGPQLKITERRRVLTYNHLRMIGHACLMFRTEHGRAPKSLEELAEAKCAPGVFGKGDLAHPDGGSYSLSSDGMSGVCSKWGRAENLTPCIEHPVTEATREEADDYKGFVTEYNQYWRTFFDPIAVRVQSSAKLYRLETLILPLIDNSIYTTMAQMLGGPVVALDTLPTPRREIGGVWVHFNKKPLLDILGPDTAPVAKKEAEKPRPGKTIKQSENDLKMLLLALHNYHDTMGTFPADVRDQGGKAILSWRVLLLPYLEEDKLYREFKLDEPWDSEHNKQLISRMPKVLWGPTKKLNEEYKTVYLAAVGKDTMFPPDGAKMSFASVTDGLSNTIAFIEAADEAAVVWSKPGDLPLDPAKPFQGLKRPGQDFILAGMADGRAERIDNKLDPAVLAAAFTRAGGEAVSLKPEEPRANQPKVAADFVNDLRQIGLAMHNFESAYQHFPPAPPFPQPPRKDGKPPKSELSWRVHMLPFVEQDQLYRQFKMGEPWDSEHNKKLIARMPRIYQGLNKKLNDEGKTIFVVPSGKGTMFPPDGAQVRIGDVTDGLSNTVMASLADDEHAVIWTKPDDVNIDWKEPLKGFRAGADGWLVVMGDGQVRRFAGTLDPKKAAALLTMAGGETVELDPTEELAPPAPPRGPAQPLFDFRLDDGDRRELEQMGIDLNKVRRFLRDGIGDQVGFHLHDGSKTFDYETSGAVNSRSPLFGGRLGPADTIGLAGLVQFVTGPSSVSIPVKDAKAVDEFLDHLDSFLTKVRESDSRELRNLLGDTEFYRLPSGDGPVIRCVAIKAFGLVYRIYWARIGDGLYIANRPFVLDDIRAARSGKKPEAKETGHAQVRVRPENWKDVLPGYNLGWAEKHRSGCHDNLSLLANVARGWNDKAVDAAVRERVARFYGIRPFCPDGGTYTLSADGRRCTCSVHGDPQDPRQLAAPTADSPTGQVLKTFAGLRATLTFHEDGLRAVVVVERKE
jgi:Protein of unknown function (DUF1559)